MQVLFVSSVSSELALMALGLASKHGGGDVRFFATSMEGDSGDMSASLSCLRTMGVDVANLELSPLELSPWNERLANSSDIIITLDEDASSHCCPCLPGQPVRLDWAIPDEVLTDKSLVAAGEYLQQHLGCLFNQNYHLAIATAREKSMTILDSLNDGIIAHDRERRIMFFNRAAEAITGLKREDVLYRDCHDVFPVRFCGEECSFCDGGEEVLDSDFQGIQYTIEYVNCIGERRFLEMSVQAIRNRRDELAGVVASIRDLTHEHELATRLGEVEGYSGIVGRHPLMLDIYDLIRSVADTNVPVLIQGESGTGKELVAAAIHNASPRRDNRFVTVNCGALPEGLLESELFGHVRGAFTRAVRDKKGRFELADGGTIFLDEIGDVSPAMQVKLLRVLQEGTFERVGGQTTEKVNARVISATNKDLAAEIAAGRFREDLYYRLCVVPIELPPLRERLTDLPLLVEHILERVGRELSRENVRLTPGAMTAILTHDWPGNVRELQNALQYALVRSQGELIESSHLPPSLSHMQHGKSISVRNHKHEKRARGRARLSRERIDEALEQTGGNKSKAAKLLGVGRATLYRFLDDKYET